MPDNSEGVYSLPLYTVEGFRDPANTKFPVAQSRLDSQSPPENIIVSSWMRAVLPDIATALSGRREIFGRSILTSFTSDGALDIISATGRIVSITGSTDYSGSINISSIVGGESNHVIFLIRGDSNPNILGYGTPNSLTPIRYISPIGLSDDLTFTGDISFTEDFIKAGRVNVVGGVGGGDTYFYWVLNVPQSNRHLYMNGTNTYVRFGTTGLGLHADKFQYDSTVRTLTFGGDGVSPSNIVYTSDYSEADLDDLIKIKKTSNASIVRNAYGSLFAYMFFARIPVSNPDPTVVISYPPVGTIECRNFLEINPYFNSMSVKHLVRHATGIQNCRLEFKPFRWYRGASGQGNAALLFLDTPAPAMAEDSGMLRLQADDATGAYPDISTGTNIDRFWGLQRNYEEFF